MRLINTVLFLTLGPLSIACASASAQEPAPPQAHPAVTYSDDDLALIMELRDRGESLAVVAKAVGGTREDVRAAERAEIARRKAGQPARVLPATARGKMPCLDLVCRPRDAAGDPQHFASTGRETLLVTLIAQ